MPLSLLHEGGQSKYFLSLFELRQNRSLSDLRIHSEARDSFFNFSQANLIGVTGLI